MRRGALFLDRDGVINEDVGYLHRPEDCRFIPGIFDLVGRARRAGLAVVVVTNQAGIARGYYDEATFEAFSRWMRGVFAQHGAPLDAIYHCPHHPSEGRAPWLRACACRKPEPGMLLRARQELDLDLSGSVLVGDHASDLEAARRAGVGSYYLFQASGVDSHVAQDLGGTSAQVITRLDSVALPPPSAGR